LPLLPLLLAALGVTMAVATTVQARTAASPVTATGPSTPPRQAASKRNDLAACAAADLDCRAFTGTLAWRPDERRPLLSSKALRRLALVRHLPGGERERALRCLAFIAWAEARSDGVEGMRAVVAVVLNRSRSPVFPVHPCEVIGQAGAFEPLIRKDHRATALALKRRALAPFPRPGNPIDAAALRTARLLVWNLARASEIHDPTRGATHFVAPAVLRQRGQAMPGWTGRMVRTARIGAHHFFRPRELALAAGQS